MCCLVGVLSGRQDRYLLPRFMGEENTGCKVKGPCREPGVLDAARPRYGGPVRLLTLVPESGYCD